MILSVVIVSYNVKFFLEQCLFSLKKAIEGISVEDSVTEVFIIDNASYDGSVEFLRPLFPTFHFIQNNENAGFAKANNQALAICKGKCVLFLNPDTLLAEDSLDICLSFLEKRQDAGAIGVRMVDGSGIYLKESKRGFPGPAASFFKMSGLTHLFPRSKLFSSYYMGHLDDESTHVVEILSGAFMMVKKKVLDQTGGFDERFFMYGEDIDLSYRIAKTGFQNYYLPTTTIIHFKGESTPKDLRQIKIFYEAMQAFIKKHLSSGSSLQRSILTLGMKVRRGLAYSLLVFKRSKRVSQKQLPVFIKGDPEAQEIWKQHFVLNNIPISDDIHKAGQIIYCEGRLLPWKMIIAEIAAATGRLIYYFHGSGTHSAVSSNSSQNRGEVIEL
jgi:N-acetylglucosaminyl-diphospho-decaprenol L-rhamnosyltransferase